MAIDEKGRKIYGYEKRQKRLVWLDLSRWLRRAFSYNPFFVGRGGRFCSSGSHSKQSWRSQSRRINSRVGSASQRSAATLRHLIQEIVVIRVRL